MKPEEYSAKQYLSRYLESDAAFNARYEKWLEDYSKISKLTAQLTGMPHGGSGRTWDDTMNKLIDEGRELQEEKNRIIDMRAEIAHQINSITDGQFKQLLSMRYISGYSFRKIAAEMHYSEDWMKHQHLEALRHFTTLFPC